MRLTGWVRENLRCEEREQAKLLALVRRTLIAGAFEGRRDMFGVRERIPRLLFRLWRSGQLSTRRLTYMLPEVWIYNPRPLASLGPRAWVQMFKATGFIGRTVEPGRMIRPDGTVTETPFKNPVSRAL
jgi:hypothetical protein